MLLSTVHQAGGLGQAEDPRSRARSKVAARSSSLRITLDLKNMGSAYNAQMSSLGSGRRISRSNWSWACVSSSLTYFPTAASLMKGWKSCSLYKHLEGMKSLSLRYS